MSPELKDLVRSIEECEAKVAALPPHQRRLRFGVYAGEGYVRGDQPRVELAAKLFNLRAEIAELIKSAE